jgi:large subunit ribosomal protein L24
MPTKADLKRAKNPIKTKLRTGDKVVIISGKDKGQEGMIAAVDPKNQKALVVQEDPENPENFIPLNAAIKHKKARVQGEKSARLRIPVPIHISNLRLIDPESGDATRVGRRKENDKLVRYAKKSDKSIEDKAAYSKEDES